MKKVQQNYKKIVNRKTNAPLITNAVLVMLVIHKATIDKENHSYI